MYTENHFVFSDKYRLTRHFVFWTVHITIFSFLFKVPTQTYGDMLFLSTLWVPAFILYSYPLAYYFVPKLLLKENYLGFSIFLLTWASAGVLLNFVFRSFVLFPVSDLLGYKTGNKNPWAPSSFLAMNVMAGFTCMIVLFKYWMVKQKEFLEAEKEKVNAELQLLKAQVKPHFLFNTLNNIYSFSLVNSSKAPDMILRLSSLLSYMLYDCQNAEVLLEKEIEIMRNYIDLEKERYSNRLEISVNLQGDIQGKYISPLLLLPFIENAFKHGTSDQLENPWLSLDLSVMNNTLRCKIINSKNDVAAHRNEGIGIQNVKKRLAYLYPGKHELKLVDEGTSYVVSFAIDLEGAQTNHLKERRVIPASQNAGA